MKGILQTCLKTESRAPQSRQVQRPALGLGPSAHLHTEPVCEQRPGWAPGVVSSSSRLRALFWGTLGAWTPSLSWTGRWDHRVIFPGKSQSPGRASHRGRAPSLLPPSAHVCILSQRLGREGSYKESLRQRDKEKEGGR